MIEVSSGKNSIHKRLTDMLSPPLNSPFATLWSEASILQSDNVCRATAWPLALPRDMSTKREEKQPSSFHLWIISKCW
jgi:hypothetical protein